MNSLREEILIAGGSVAVLPDWRTRSRYPAASLFIGQSTEAFEDAREGRDDG